MKAFSFVHAADLHLGYAQYGLETRRMDFDNTFRELVEKTIALKPDFLIIAGDLFHQARPSNVTLENAISCFAQLRKAEIPVLTVDGSHDSAPNSITGTILNPLDSAGLIFHLPRHEGACWTKPGCCYVYGVPNFRTKHRTEEMFPEFLARNPPRPDSSLFNVFVLHMAVDLPGVRPPYIEAEVRPELIPDGFDYYAAGHIHKSYMDKFKGGTLVYSGSTETTDYADAGAGKGFYHVKVDEDKTVHARFETFEKARKFVVIEDDFSGVSPSKITDRAIQLVKGVDAEGVVIVPVVKGTLPAEARRTEIDLSKIKSAAEKALLVHPVIQLRESEVSDEVVRSIFESKFTDLRTKAVEYFLKIFAERHTPTEAEKMARIAVDLVEPIVKKEEGKVKQTIEELLK